MTVLLAHAAPFHLHAEEAVALWLAALLAGFLAAGLLAAAGGRR